MNGAHKMLAATVGAVLIVAVVNLVGDPAPPAAVRPVAVSPTALAAPKPSTSAPGASAAPGSALTALALLAVKGRAAMTGYDRQQYGQAWYDLDRNGCDTRNDILRRDLTAPVIKAGTYGCLVLSGTLHDPYGGTTIPFFRGVGSSLDVQIDHVVALADAWQKGAQQLPFERRVGLANDPLNLLAVDGSLNQQKGAGDAATWLPPNRAIRAAYIARQIAVKVKYGLWVTAAERDVMRRVLDAEPGTVLPASG